ncbi:unnamed protein product, partial [Rotaria sp. Silwood1]
KPFSEIETAQVSRFISRHNGTFVHYVNFHAYSQLWMSPWGYTLTKPEQFKLQDDGSAKAVQALRAVFGIHAREWISPATIIYMVHALLSNYDKDP